MRSPVSPGIPARGGRIDSEGTQLCLRLLRPVKAPMTLRHVIVGLYIAVSVLLVGEMTYRRHDAASVIPDYLDTGTYGYVVILVVFSVPVSSAILAALVGLKARVIFMLPFIVHTVAIFPVTVVPAVLLVVERLRKGDTNEPT